MYFKSGSSNTSNGPLDPNQSCDIPKINQKVPLTNPTVLKSSKEPDAVDLAIKDSKKAI